MRETSIYHAGDGLDQQKFVGRVVSGSDIAPTPPSCLGLEIGRLHCSSE
jgi:hypothetical protein